MTSKLLILATAVLLLAGCNNNSKQTEASNPQESAVKNVPGRKNFGASHAVITPEPCIMIATYDKNRVPNVMMAAWGAQCGDGQIEFNLSPHKTTENLKLKKAFTVSFATEDDIAQSDYFGIVSGNDVPDKVKRAGFTVTPSPNVDAPIINEYKLTLECKVISMEKNENGDTRVVGQVVNWSADPSILDENGKVDLEKLKPVIFDSSSLTYRSVGKSVAGAWQAGKRFQ
ncbi:MAG: flavin reductase family protein [Prevotella sp.]|jgi:flavin reductase (DIM6/NTAB) family NADH-FMN oxidoreductase RutF